MMNLINCYLLCFCFLMTVNCVYQVKLQKHNTEATGVKYKNGMYCAARILKTEGVCLFTASFPNLSLCVSCACIVQLEHRRLKEYASLLLWCPTLIFLFPVCGIVEE